MNAKMTEKCEQCTFDYARIDTECWNSRSSRRVMCPVCGWTRYEEHEWEEGASRLIKTSTSAGYGAYRLIPPGGFSGYNAFHTAPKSEVISQIKELLNAHGWKGYLTLWDPGAGKPRLVAGSPLQKYEVPD